MAGVIPAHILVHVAIPQEYEREPVDAADWAEGEPGSGPSADPAGVPFACVLFMPSAGGAQADQYRPRVVTAPTLLCNPTRDVNQQAEGPFPELVADGSPIRFGYESDLLVIAPELAAWTGGESVRWQVDGEPQPFGRPGTVMGIMAQLRQVRG